MSTNTDRLREIFTRAEVVGECLEWQGARYGHGYGLMRVDGKTKPVHRRVYELTHGVSLESHQYICHSCDNPPCINPDHLWLGNHAANCADKARKGRGSRPGAVLTPEQVVDIRSRYVRGRSHHPGNKVQLAEEFGVTPGAISKIVNRWNWKGVA